MRVFSLSGIQGLSVSEASSVLKPLAKTIRSHSLWAWCYMNQESATENRLMTLPREMWNRGYQLYRGDFSPQEDAPGVQTLPDPQEVYFWYPKESVCINASSNFPMVPASDLGDLFQQGVLMLSAYRMGHENRSASVRKSLAEVMGFTPDDIDSIRNLSDVVSDVESLKSDASSREE